MNKLVTKHIEFECAHLLNGYDGGCKNLHGHSYKLEVTLIGPSQRWGMIMDFKELKKILESVVPDHKFVGRMDDPVVIDMVAVLDKYNLDYVLYPFDTTAENMVEYFVSRINHAISSKGYKKIEVFEAKLWETSTSYAEWRAI